jgi:hypothetical protein
MIARMALVAGFSAFSICRSASSRVARDRFTLPARACVSASDFRIIGRM